MQRLVEDLDADAVSGLLRSLRVHSTVYCRTEFRAPWGIAVRPGDVPIFHLISQGECWLEVEGLEQPVRVSRGDVVLLMTGRGHRLCDDPTSPTQWLDDIIAATPPSNGQLAYGGTGAVAEMICGCFQLEGARADPFLLALPPLLRLEGNQAATADWVDALLAMLRAEVAHPQLGGDAMLARLADLVVTQAIRGFLASVAATDEPSLAALRDPRVAKAIRLFHADAGHQWTVAEMAVEVGMSRSSFAALFRQLTGDPPMRYLTRCRLARAASHLAADDLTVFAIAQMVGYDSEASLNRAFSRTFGMAPGAYRRRLRDSAGADSILAFPEVLANGFGDL